MRRAPRGPSASRRRSPSGRRATSAPRWRSATGCRRRTSRSSSGAGRSRTCRASLLSLVTTGLTNEQKDFVEALRSFCERECAPGKVGDLGERDDHHSESIAKRMAELGWYGLTIPEEYGG